MTRFPQIPVFSWVLRYVKNQGQPYHCGTAGLRPASIFLGRLFSRLSQLYCGIPLDLFAHQVAGRQAVCIYAADPLLQECTGLSLVVDRMGVDLDPIFLGDCGKEIKEATETKLVKAIEECKAQFK